MSGLFTLIKDHLAGGHPGWRRCSSLKYSRYSRSSRLAIRAPRSAIWSSFSVDRPRVAGLKACANVRGIL